MASRFWNALDHFRTSRWGVLLFYAYLVGLALAASVAVYAIRDNHRLAVKANVAAMLANRSLCFQKRAAVKQLTGAKQFLRDHPDGTGDFSRSLILNAIHNDELDLFALRDIHCPTGGRP